MRTLLGSYLLATLLVTPLAQWLCAVPPAVAFCAALTTGIVFASVHLAIRAHRTLEVERREAAAVQKRLSASLFGAYFQTAVEERQGVA